MITKQPKAFYILFFAELWERFGYYGIAFLLVLFMTHRFGYTDHQAYATYSTFCALVTISPLIGGYLADTIMGYQRGVIIGCLILTLGYALLAFPGTFFFALSLIVLGNGIFKTCPISLLGKVYGPNDPRLDSGFTLFYMSINIGGLISVALSGVLARTLGWSLAFSVSSLGLIIGLATFLYYRKKFLHNVGSRRDLQAFDRAQLPKILLTCISIVGVSYLLLHNQSLSQVAFILISIAVVVFHWRLCQRQPLNQRRRLYACYMLIAVTVAFFTLYYQAPMSINLFIERNVNHHLLGMNIPTSSFGALTAFWLIATAPVVATLYTMLKKKLCDPSITIKFALGLIIMGLGFFVLTVATRFHDATGHISAWWIVGSYFIQAIAELLVSALGLAMVAHYAPPQLLGTLIGTYYLALSAGAAIAGKLAELSTIPKNLGALASLPIYADAFYHYGLLSVVVGIAVFGLIPVIKRLEQPIPSKHRARCAISIG